MISCSRLANQLALFYCHILTGLRSVHFDDAATWSHNLCVRLLRNQCVWRASKRPTRHNSRFNLVFQCAGRRIWEHYRLGRRVEFLHSRLSFLPVLKLFDPFDFFGNVFLARDQVCLRVSFACFDTLNRVWLLAWRMRMEFVHRVQRIVAGVSTANSIRENCS